MRRTTVIAGSAVAAVVAAGIAVPALASDTGSDTGPGGDPGSSDSLREQHEQRHEEARAEFAARLADELGLDADEVSAAIEKVADELRAERSEERLAALRERLDEAVEAGRLTREQADALLAAAESGDLRAGLRSLHRGLHGFGPLGGLGGPGFGGGPGEPPGGWGEAPDDGLDSDADATSLQFL